MTSPQGLEAHPLANLFPLLAGEELQALTDDIAVNGLRQPIILHDDPPRVLDGRNRLKACEMSGVKPRFETFEGSEDEALALVLSLNLARRHLTTPQRAALALKLLPLEKGRAARRRRQAAEQGQNFAGAAGKATDVAGARVGVSGETVRQAARLANAAPETIKAIDEGLVSTMPEALRLAAIPPERRPKVIEHLREHGGRVALADEQLVEVVNTNKCSEDRLGAEFTANATSSVSHEWYTPKKYVDAVREAFGGVIELDPASCQAANKIVKAKRIFTKETDGFSQPWKAKSVYCNPPYGRDGSAGRWAAKLIEECRIGHAREGILLTHARTEKRWFQQLWAFPICFIDHPMTFIRGDGNKVAGTSMTGQVFVYIGPNIGRFQKAFSPLGHIVLPP